MKPPWREYFCCYASKCQQIILQNDSMRLLSLPQSQKKNVNKEFLEISATAGDLTNLQTILLSGGSCLAHTFTSLVLTIGSCWCAMPTCHCAHSHKQTDRQKPFVLKSPRLNQHFVMIWAASEYTYWMYVWFQSLHLLDTCPPCTQVCLNMCRWDVIFLIILRNLSADYLTQKVKETSCCTMFTFRCVNLNTNVVCNRG